ncbi:CPBP family intramembrane glutamic endopeptidase [Streptococcus himalayensis]|uniref:Membrane protein n=1 Tax=Streptococcus himalayensis TaxID=1888195 RepID=A0A917A7X1_9STRE|nr:type II CAAX endopeptidase family protein [Streptococcus himalayensis]GGE31398.1 membrane protein [Streptococcus himalayensis]
MKIVKNVLQVWGLVLLIQLPVLGEMDWGDLEPSKFSLLFHLLYWGVSLSLIFWGIYTLRKKALQTRHEQVSTPNQKISYLKIIFLVFLAIVLEILLSNIFPREKNFSNAVKLHDIFSNYGWMTLMTLNLLSPALEELVFRGIFQEKLSHHYSKSIAIFFSTVVFAFLHTYTLDTHFFQHIISGFLFSWLYSQTGDIKKSIFAHIAKNTLTTILHLFL